MLVAVGVIVGFVILLVKDKPPEVWAAKTIWGVADKEGKWRDFDAEVREANKVLLCAQIDFSFRWNLIENLGASAMAAEGAGLLGQEPTYTREAWLRFMLPETLRNRLGWEMRVLCIGRRGRNAGGYGFLYRLWIGCDEHSGSKRYSPDVYGKIRERYYHTGSVIHCQDDTFPQCAWHRAGFYVFWQRACYRRALADY
ncbi:hypothetical protein [Ralstonia pseudosolanacearum]|uniref:Uncharacterized protein n=1 Tax=Ralstonia solanacearum TaxID=305 RepID=A0ABY6NJT4_RALSL|nr:MULTISPECIES: hypothetical protein [Ralstonia]UZF17535.1 hypothetical protein LH706_18440 [Ralstonia solanacearum]UZF32285.1 hypothetical protein LGV82_24750 [Ralstonia sp. RS650]